MIKPETVKIPAHEVKVGQKVWNQGSRRARSTVETVTGLKHSHIPGSPGEFDGFTVITVLVNRGHADFEYDGLVEVVVEKEVA